MEGVDDLSDGKVNAIGLLFSDNDLYEYPTYPSGDIDYYGIGVQNNTYYNKGQSTTNIKLIVSEGIKDHMGISAGDLLRW